MIRLVSAVVLLAFVTGCGSAEDDAKAGRNIRQVSEVNDLSLSEARPTTALNELSEATIGFDSAGRETRLLIFFPELQRLYTGDLVMSSITSVEVQLALESIPINPENITLRAVTRAWSPFATWESAYGGLPGFDWDTPGGDVDSQRGGVHPAIRASSRSSLKELTFDITGLVLDRLVADAPNYGFIVTVQRSPLNNADALSVHTRNAADGTRPLGALVFSSKDTISQ